MENLIKFISLYSEVFDSNGNVTLCGREKCKELIEAAIVLQKELDFGNEKTGLMNIENIRKLYTRVGYCTTNRIKCKE